MNNPYYRYKTLLHEASRQLQYCPSGERIRATLPEAALHKRLAGSRSLPGKNPHNLKRSAAPYMMDSDHSQGGEKYKADSNCSVLSNIQRLALQSKVGLVCHLTKRKQSRFLFARLSLNLLTGLPSYRYSTQSGTKGNQENR